MAKSRFVILFIICMFVVSTDTFAMRDSIRSLSIINDTDLPISCILYSNTQTKNKVQYKSVRPRGVGYIDIPLRCDTTLYVDCSLDEERQIHGDADITSDPKVRVVVSADHLRIIPTG